MLLLLLILMLVACFAVIILFKAIGSAPLMRQNQFKVTGLYPFQVRLSLWLQQGPGLTEGLTPAFGGRFEVCRQSFEEDVRDKGDGAARLSLSLSSSPLPLTLS